MKILSVIGSSKSGKTATVEYLIAKLTERGLNIGSAKHVHHPNFTIDVEGKDTWRHAKAGATRVVCVAENEVTVFRKEHGPDYTLEKLEDLFKDGGFDLIILEGFHWLLTKREDVVKIVSANDAADVERLLNGTSPPIIAITGRVSNEEKGPLHGIPVINVKQNGEQLVKLVLEQFNL
ncbi:MAG: molybdopterin-guanine dinucleotide biosynthesis protein B [Thaumarchaeota archaeon]|nr:molybdopterin-guanine dinucleotide biosynthesis protein B [Nitrososphaerota archaeon]MCL5316701.1 molybdopterin-guanine dinucleotide biosynthesis protein B [Nitrososphaerota archaeon]